MAVYLLQSIVGMLRVRDRFGGAVDNRPLLLVREGELLEENLRRASISVAGLHANSPDAGVEDWLLEGVRDPT